MPSQNHNHSSSLQDILLKPDTSHYQNVIYKKHNGSLLVTNESVTFVEDNDDDDAANSITLQWSDLTQIKPNKSTAAAALLRLTDSNDKSYMLKFLPDRSELERARKDMKQRWKQQHGISNESVSQDNSMFESATFHESATFNLLEGDQQSSHHNTKKSDKSQSQLEQIHEDIPADSKHDKKKKKKKKNAVEYEEEQDEAAPAAEEPAEEATLKKKKHKKHREIAVEEEEAPAAVEEDSLPKEKKHKKHRKSLVDEPEAQEPPTPVDESNPKQHELAATSEHKKEKKHRRKSSKQQLEGALPEEQSIPPDVEETKTSLPYDDDNVTDKKPKSRATGPLQKKRSSKKFKQDPPVKEPVQSSPRMPSVKMEPAPSSPRKSSVKLEPLPSSPRKSSVKMEPVPSSPRKPVRMGPNAAEAPTAASLPGAFSAQADSGDVAPGQTKKKRRSTQHDQVPIPVPAAAANAPTLVEPGNLVSSSNQHYNDANNSDNNLRASTGNMPKKVPSRGSKGGKVSRSAPSISPGAFPARGGHDETTYDTVGPRRTMGKPEIQDGAVVSKPPPRSPAVAEPEMDVGPTVTGQEIVVGHCRNNISTEATGSTLDQTRLLKPRTSAAAAVPATGSSRVRSQRNVATSLPSNRSVLDTGDKEESTRSVDIENPAPPMRRPPSARIEPSDRGLPSPTGPPVDEPIIEAYVVRQDDGEKERFKMNRRHMARFLWATLICIVLLIIVIVVPVVVTQKKSDPKEPVAAPPTMPPTSNGTSPSSNTTESYPPSIDLIPNLPDYTLQSILEVGSPQRLALDWLASYPNVQSIEEPRRKQLFALATFYHSFSGLDWPLETSFKWLSYNEPECQWQQSEYPLWLKTVQCNERSMYESIYFTAWPGMVGTLPPELEQLPFLASLGMENCSVSSTIPPQLQNLPNLLNLDLRFNALTGTVPPWLGGFGSLSNLILHSNQLVGPVPSTLGQLTRLNTLALSMNELTGTIPTEVGKLIGLETLLLHTNKLGGTIPTEVQALQRVAMLDLASNSLTGAIPKEIYMLDKLSNLGLQFNKLSGTIGTEIGLLQQLTTLTLHGNPGLGGTIPSELGQARLLTELYIYETSLGGTLPSFIGDLQQLTFVQLQKNKLGGTLPTFLGLATAVQQLYLFGNTFVGTVPSELGFLTRMTAFGCGFNSLTGTIPSEIGRMSLAIELGLYNNGLRGSLPTELGLMTQLTYLDFSTNQLTNTIPSELGLLTQLIQLQVYENNIIGTVPLEICQIPTLTEIKIDCTKVTGGCPEGCACSCAEQDT